MKRFIISQALWALCHFVAISTAHAEDTGSAKAYSLPQFIQTGLKNNYGLQIVSKCRIFAASKFECRL